MIVENGYSVELDQCCQQEWDRLVGEFDDASLYQTWVYGKVRWGEKNLSHIVLKREGKAVCMAQLRILKVPLLKSGIAYALWGPLWRHSTEKDPLQNLKNMLRVMYGQYVVERRMLLRLKPQDLCFSDKVRSVYQGESYRRNSACSPYRTLLVDLAPSLDELRKNLRQKWRNQLNRALKNDLSISEGTDGELFERFLQLYHQMISRKGFKPGVEVEEFKEIQRGLPEELKMRIVICGADGRDVSSTIYSAIGERAVYLLGATGTDGLKWKGSYLSQWKILERLKDQGKKSYDLGGINPETNPGVYHFKSGFNGSEAFSLGTYDASKNGLLSTLIQFSDRIKHSRSSRHG